MTTNNPEVREIPRGLTLLGMFLVVVGMQVFIIQPGLIAIIAGRLNLTEDWAGYIASGEMAGIAAATILLAFVGTRWSWPKTAVAGAALALAGNLASVFITDPALFLASRTVAGFGCGFLISIGYSVVGLSSNADRDFGRLISLVLVYGAAGVFVLPTADAMIGLGGIMAVLAALNLVAIPMAMRLPTSGHSAVTTHGEIAAEAPMASARMRPVPVLIAGGLFFLGQGFVWAFLSLIGLSFGIAEQAVANGLMVAQLAGIGGAFCLAWLGGRYSQSTFLIVGSLASFLPLLALLGGASAVGYGAGVTVFNFAANLLTPLLMAMAAVADTSGKTVQRAAAVQMIGLAAGPALAAPLAASFGFPTVLVVASALFASTAIAGIYALRSRQHHPANAEGLAA